MTQAQQPEALRLAHIFDSPLPPEWPDMVAAAAELRRLHAENVTLQQGYDASRLEIESLRARVQELGQMLRENRSKRIVALEAENLGLLHALAAEQDANTDLRQQLEAIGAGGVEPLRRRDHFRGATKMTQDAGHEQQALEQDAARYRWLRWPKLHTGHGSIQVTVDDRGNTGNLSKSIFLEELDNTIDAAREEGGAA